MFIFFSSRLFLLGNIPHSLFPFFLPLIFARLGVRPLTSPLRAFLPHHQKSSIARHTLPIRLLILDGFSPSASLFSRGFLFFSFAQHSLRCPTFLDPFLKLFFFHL